MKYTIQVLLLVFFTLFYADAALSSEKADLVVVVKGEYNLYLIREGRLFASFPVVFGSNPKGHKQQQGDDGKVYTSQGEYATLTESLAGGAK